MLKLNITSTILDKLGFSPYFDRHGTWGTRTLAFSDGTQFTIIEQEEMDDDTEGYASNGIYLANHFYFAGWIAKPKTDIRHELFFLHDMYECIQKHYHHCLPEFEDKCRQLKMGRYIDDYLNERFKECPTIFKLYDKVIDNDFGAGVVVEIVPRSENYPITVVFDSTGEQKFYTGDGRSHSTHPITLSKAED